MRMVGARSVMRVPLLTPEGPLGSMLLFETGSRRRFDEEDLRRAEELAARCSLAIENARAYRAARRGGERRFGRRPDSPAGSPTEPRPAE
jgi:GAF domain-containing protein